ncbi:MAG: cyclic pyranopterin monophosphate synthase MoaC [Armatimonadetes bacterium]|nr:cyclic pyranopterin monophosphate synthase MoaC [Armatimonadota bacterium]
MAERLTHLDDQGRARMVDVSEKPDTRRVAEAEGRVRMRPETVALIREQGIAKGDVLTVARVAGILGAKQTAALIPMCHPLLLMDVRLELELEEAAVAIRSAVTTVGKTGAEMEALTAISTAALTIYDMCKAVDRGMVLEGMRVVRKTGGKSDWGAGPAEGPGG